jgi:succinoglycan biosynthesis transport protein ExoP
MNQEESQLRTEEVHLRDYIHVINKRRTLVVAVFAVIFVMVVLYTFASTPLYRGTTKVLIEKATNSALTGNSPSRIYDPEFYETQFQLIKSRAVAKRVVVSHDLADNFAQLRGGGDDEESMLSSIFGWFGSAKDLIKGLIGDSQPVGEELASDLLTKTADLINQDILVKPFKNSRLVTISYLAPSPEFAAMIANATAKAYIQETMEMKLASTRTQLEWMTKKANEEGLKLDSAEQALQRYMVANDIISLENRMSVTPEQLSQISTQLVIAESKRKQLESLYSKVRSVANDYKKAETIPAIAVDPALQMIRSQILQAEQDLRELSGTYLSKHPLMKKAKADLEILNEKRDQEIARIIESIHNEYEFSVSTEENLQAQMDRTKAQAQGLGERFIQYGALKREVDTNRTMYDALLLKIKEQSITEETQAVSFWIVEEAIISEEPVKPNKKKNLLLGLIVGLMAGVGMAFFVEYLDNTIKYPEETEKALGLPVLGLISLWKETDVSIDQAVDKKPRSPVAESYKALRTSLMLSSADGMPVKILIASAAASAGKTTTALNLSFAMAQAGKKVMLIDADMRKPRIHKVMKMTNKIGLSIYLSGGMSSILKKSSNENLDVITSGPIPPNPSELLSSKHMQGLMNNLKDNYDVIIVDSPPLLSVADARILTRVCDGTVLVVRAKQTTFDLARKAIRLLSSADAPVLGMVINALDLKKSDYYYQYYYGSYETYEDLGKEGDAES